MSKEPQLGGCFTPPPSPAAPGITGEPLANHALEFTTHPNLKLRQRSLIVLGALQTKNPSVTTAAINSLGDEQDQVTGAALDLLGQIGQLHHPSALPHLARLVSNPDTLIGVRSAVAIIDQTNAGSEAALTSLNQILSVDAPLPHRNIVIEQLVMGRCTRAIPILGQNSLLYAPPPEADTQPYVTRYDAGVAIREIGALTDSLDGLPYLLIATQDTDHRVRSIIAQAIYYWTREYPNLQLPPDLIGALEVTSHLVPQSTHDALGYLINPTPTFTDLHPTLQDLSEPATALRNRIAISTTTP